MQMLRILEPSTEYNTVLNSEFLRSTGFKTVYTVLNSEFLRSTGFKTNYFYFEFYYNGQVKCNQIL